MKTIVKLMAATCTILLVSQGLMAQNRLLLQDIQPMTAYASVSHYDIVLSADYNSDSYQFYMEEKLEFSEWMVNRAQWKNSESSLLMADLREEIESEPVLEDWMVRNFEIDRKKLDALLKVEEEAPLELSRWMYCCTDWKMASL